MSSPEKLVIALTGSTTANFSGNLTISDAGFISQTESVQATNSLSVTLQPKFVVNPNAQKLADAVIAQMWNPEVELFCTDASPGCTDYEGEPPGYNPRSFPCKDTFYLGANIHLCYPFQDFGYEYAFQQALAKCIYLGGLKQPLNGMRYEALVGNPIVVGNPGDTHMDNSVNPPVPFPPVATQKLNNGTLIQIRQDRWNGQGRGTPNPNAPIDTLVPQAVNAALRGNPALATSLALSAHSRWKALTSTWQLGQVLYALRLLGLDSQVLDFPEMEAKLWATPLGTGTGKQGLLANMLDGSGGHDEENQNAGLLYNSPTTIAYVRSQFGKYTMSSPP